MGAGKKISHFKGGAQAMISSKSPGSLARNERREAHAPFRGYRFQALYTAFLWCKLGEGQSLELEGAEDADLIDVNLGTATVYQIKDMPSKKVSLRSKGVRDLLNNLPSYIEKNPDLDVTAVYVTTSTRGKERGFRFESKSGLDEWEACILGNCETGPLFKFLSEEAGLSEGTIGFLRSVGSDEVVKRFLKRVCWKTDVNSEQVRAELEHELGQISVALGLPPSVAVKALPSVVEFVSERMSCSQKEKRTLTAYDLREALERHALISIDRRTYSMIRNLAVVELHRDLHLAVGKERELRNALIESLGAEPCYKTSSQEVYLRFGRLVECYNKSGGRSVQECVTGSKHGGEAKDTPSVLSREERLIVGLIATSPMLWTLGHLKDLGADIRWEPVVRSLCNAGYLVIEPASSDKTSEQLTVAPKVEAIIVADKAEVDDFHMRWIELLSPRSKHPDIALFLGLHWLSLGETNTAIDLVTEAARDYDGGIWNRYFSDFLETILKTHRRRRMVPRRRAALLDAYGLVLARGERYKEAIEMLGRLRRHAKRHNLAWYVGQSLINVGVVKYELGDTKAAARYYEKAVCHAEATQDRILLGRSLNNLAQVTLDKDYCEAEKYLRRSIRVKRQIGDRVGVIGSYLTLGRFHSVKGKHKLAKQAFGNAERKARRLGVPKEQSLALFNLGSTEFNLGNPERAILHYEHALAIARQEGYLDAMHLATQGLALAQGALGRSRDAIGYLEDLLEIAVHRQDDLGAVIAQHDIGIELINCNRKEEAREAFSQALGRARRIGAENWVYKCLLANAISDKTTGGRKGLATRLGSLALKEHAIGFKRAAARLFDAQLRLLIEIDAPTDVLMDTLEVAIGAATGMPDVLTSIYTAYYAVLARRGRPRAKLLHTLDKLAKAASQAGYASELQAALDQKAVVLQEMGYIKQAIGVHKRALRIAVDAKDTKGMGVSLSNLGEAYRKQGRISDAVETLECAVVSFQAIGDIDGILLATHNKALALQQAGSTEDANHIFISLRGRAKRLKRPRDQVRAVIALGNLAWADGRKALALRRYRSALDIAKTAQLNSEYLLAATSLSLALRTSGQVQEAICLMEPVASNLEGGGTEVFGVISELAEAYEEAGKTDLATVTWGNAKNHADRIGDAKSSKYARHEMIRCGNLAREHKLSDQESD